MFSRALFGNDLYLGRRSLIINAIVLIGIMAMFALFAETLIGNEEMTKLLESYPQAVLDAFGMSIQSFSTFEGYMAGEAYIFFLLLLGSYAAIMACTSIAREVDQKTGEAVFSLPISRSTNFMSKVVSQLIQVTLLFIGSAAVSVLLGMAMTDVANPGGIVLMFLGGYLVCLAFAGIGYAITPFIDSERGAMSLGIGIVVLSFLFNTLAGVNGPLSNLAKISLFRLFDAQVAAMSSKLSVVGVIVALAIYVVGIAVGLKAFSGKNLSN